jgi:hypothetical protein
MKLADAPHYDYKHKNKDSYLETEADFVAFMNGLGEPK